jgi:membrane-associated phospholipid phosphatase
MKRTLIYILTGIFLLLSGSQRAYGQYGVEDFNFDKDIFAIRESVIPDFHYTYDDWLQYGPAALMVGLKAGGYESRSSWGRMLTSDAVSVAVMAAAVNGVKYSVRRLRPDGSRYNSFPSGHTATAFMTATLLHKEYGWRNPWFSIGGYTAAAVTGFSRLMNNKHWMSDVAAGAAIGIGSVHLGYFITDKIFKDRGLNSSYTDPEFYFDADSKHYVAELFFGRRFVIGADGMKEMGSLPVRGGITGISADIPLVPRIGLTARASASSMTYSSGATVPMFSTMAGGFWNFNFARRLELQTRVLAGYAWMNESSGIDLAAGLGLSLITDSNFKVKAFADFESVDFGPDRPWVNTIILGWSSAWFW